MLLFILLTACSSTSSPPSSAANKAIPLTSTPTTAPDLSLSEPGPGPSGSGAPGCHPPSPIDSLAEIRGTATGAQLWALLFASQPIHLQQSIKIVWKMTGTGPFSISTHGPQKKQAQLTFGPELHSGSNWNRPGDEWGTGFIFPLAGCWDLHITRGAAYGDVWLIVQGS
jgi:hypothetical protein